MIIGYQQANKSMELIAERLFVDIRSNLQQLISIVMPTILWWGNPRKMSLGIKSHLCKDLVRR